MSTAIFIITALFALATAVAAILYIPKFKQIFGAARKPHRIIARSNRKISLVIPARNESATIGALFSSIMRQDYPANSFSVNVIVKQANDPTCELAKKIGAKVFVVPDQTCKGAAIDGYFKSLTDEERKKYDAFVIVDADAVLSDDYISELNNALEHNKQIYVTNKRVKNFLAKGKTHSWVTDCSALIYPILDDLGNVYRSRHNVPLNLCGQGLMVTADVIETLGGWPYRSLTEDYELKLDGFLHGFSMLYYPYAIIYTEEVLKHKDSYLRRLRWIKGYSQCDKKYRKAIAEKIRRENLSSDVKFDLISYKNAFIVYMSAVAFTVFSGIVCSIYSSALGLPYITLSVCLLIVTPLLSTYLLVFIYCALAMACCRAGLIGFSLARIIKTLFIAPVFIMEFIPMYIRCRYVPDDKVVWQETARVSYSGRM